MLYAVWAVQGTIWYHRYFTVALTALSHFCPAVFIARTAKRWVPADTVTNVLSDLLPGSLYFFTPSIQSCMFAMVPLTVAAAFTSSGELVAPPLGVQMWTPAEDGALHTVEVGTTTRAFGVAGMVNGEPGAAVMRLGVTV